MLEGVNHIRWRISEPLQTNSVMPQQTFVSLYSDSHLLHGQVACRNCSLNSDIDFIKCDMDRITVIHNRVDVPRRTHKQVFTEYLRTAPREPDVSGRLVPMNWKTWLTDMGYRRCEWCGYYGNDEQIGGGGEGIDFYICLDTERCVVEFMFACVGAKLVARNRDRVTVEKDNRLILDFSPTEAGSPLYRAMRWCGLHCYDDGILQNTLKIIAEIKKLLQEVYRGCLRTIWQSGLPF